MSADNSQAQSTQTGARLKPRMESLSDLIFGLALSIGAIALVSNINNIQDNQTLLNDITVFGYSFLILIVVWLRYSRVMSLLPFERRWTTLLNTALLFTVSLEPFLFNIELMGFKGIRDFASQLYALDLGAMLAILATFSLVLADENRKLVSKDLLRSFKLEGIYMSIGAGFFLVSVLETFNSPAFLGLTWRSFLWIFPFILSSIRRRGAFVVKRIQRFRAHQV